jgi:hypothetical protein
VPRVNWEVEFGWLEKVIVIIIRYEKPSSKRRKETKGKLELKDLKTNWAGV